MRYLLLIVLLAGCASVEDMPIGVGAVPMGAAKTGCQKDKPC